MPDTDAVGATLNTAAAWLRTWLAADGQMALVPAVDVIGTGDGNLSNFLWDGTAVRLVDFEHARRSERAVDLAEVAEHLSARGVLDADEWLRRFDLAPGEARRLQQIRALCSTYWLLCLLPGGGAASRNPAEALGRASAARDGATGPGTSLNL
jgi:thiamine kinase-like enzyme